MQNQCAEIKIRAERKLGQMLDEMEKDKGGRPKKNQSQDVTGFTLKEIGIPRMQAHRNQKIARIPDDPFERHITQQRATKKELTSVGVLRLAKEQNREHVQTLRQKYRNVQKVNQENRPPQSLYFHI